MHNTLRGVVTILSVLSLTPCFVAAVQLAEAEEDLINAWRPGDSAELHPFRGTNVKLDSLQHALYCGNRDQVSTPKCVRYQYDSNALVEAFIVDGHAFQAREEAGQDLVSDDVIVPGSYCIGRSCELTADLLGVEDWCLMFMNIDSDLVTADIHFEYKVCVDNDHKDDLILILSVTCVALVVIAFLMCLSCCWMMRYRKRNTETAPSKDEMLAPLNPPPPFIPPPMHRAANDVFFSMPPPPPLPLVSHAPFRHEPSFQVQPPLPISHVPPPPASTSQPSTSSQEIHVQFPKSPRRSRSKSFKKIRFPI